MSCNIARPTRRLGFVVALAWGACAAGGAHAQQVFSGSGATAADLVPVVDGYRATLGTLNPNVAGSFGSGRREINWDGVPDARAAPNNLPADFFNVNSPRGVVFATPGTGFQVSANAASGTPVQFGNIDPAYPDFFEPFSAPRLFTALDSNIVDVNFFVPGSSQAATTRGFGAVFSDVDLANTTSISFFDASNALLGTFYAPASTAANEGFSFLGVTFTDPVVARVRITSGNQALSAGHTQEDLVVMDDFIYAEPMAIAAVPEPESWALLLGGLGVLAWLRRGQAARATASRKVPFDAH